MTENELRDCVRTHLDSAVKYLAMLTSETTDLERGRSYAFHAWDVQDVIDTFEEMDDV